MKRTKWKKVNKPPAAGRATIKEWFEVISLDDESAREAPVAERPPYKKRKTKAEARSIYKYPRARAYYDNLQASHTLEEMHKMLAVGLEFQDLGMVKIEHIIRSLVWKVLAQSFFGTFSYTLMITNTLV